MVEFRTKGKGKDRTVYPIEEIRRRKIAKARKLIRQIKHETKFFRNRIQLENISEPYNNPLITAPGLNPIREYTATIYRNGKKEEIITGVLFANQGLHDRLQHHAALRGHGLLPVKGTEGIPPFQNEAESFLRNLRTKEFEPEFERLAKARRKRK